MGIPVLLNIIVAFFFCDIETEIDYSWYSGLWHGLCIIGNLILSFFNSSRLLKASDPSIAYYILLGIGIVISVIIIEALKIMADASAKKLIEREINNHK